MNFDQIIGTILFHDIKIYHASTTYFFEIWHLFLFLFFLFQELSQVCLDGEAREVLHKIQQQVDVVKQTAERISSSAEVYGAVQVTFLDDE